MLYKGIVFTTAKGYQRFVGLWKYWHYSEFDLTLYGIRVFPNSPSNLVDFRRRFYLNHLESEMEEHIFNILDDYHGSTEMSRVRILINSFCIYLTILIVTLTGVECIEVGRINGGK